MPCRLAKPLAPLLAAALLTACASRSERIGDELVELGVEPQMAQCLGTRLAEDLSTDQLRQLGRAIEAYRETQAPDGGLSLRGLTRAATEIEDLESVAVVTRAGIACGLSQV